MNAPAYVLEGTEFNFDSLVLENSRKGLVLVDFWAQIGRASCRERV